MTLLVTGGGGYIGSQVVRDLARLRPRETLRILDVLEKGHAALADLPPARYEFHEVDISKGDLRPPLQGVETVLDLAGFVSVPRSFQQKEQVFNVNVGGIQRLLEACREAGVKRYLYTSSSSVYGSTDRDAPEDTPCNPLSPYGESKLQAEAALQKAAEEWGLRVAMLRPATVHGWNNSMRFDTVVGSFVFKACAGQEIPVWDTAQHEKRPYVHVRDVSGSFLHALDRHLEGVYNIVAENAPLRHVLDLLLQLVPQARVAIRPSPNPKTISYTLDGAKLGRAGYTPRLTLEEGMREVYERFRPLRGTTR